jgi:hypothetical protein
MMDYQGQRAEELGFVAPTIGYHWSGPQKLF